MKVSKSEGLRLSGEYLERQPNKVWMIHTNTHKTESSYQRVIENHFV